MLEPSLTLASTLMGWLTDPRNPPLICALKLIHQPEPAVLAASLAMHSATLTMLALPMLTAADTAELVGKTAAGGSQLGKI